MTKTVHGRSQVQLSVAFDQRLIGGHEARKHRSAGCPVVAPDHPCQLNVHREIAQPAPSPTPTTLSRDAVLTGLAGRLGQKAF